MTQKQLVFAALISGLTVGPACAAVSTFGTTSSRLCFEAADGSYGKRSGLDECNRALTEEALGTRDRAATHVNRGILRLMLKDVNGALADYNEAIVLKPNLGDAYLNRGFLFLRQGNKDEEALAELTRGIQLGSSNLAAGYYGRAFANELTGRVAEAYYDFKKAAELKPGWASPKEQLSRFQVKSGE